MTIEERLKAIIGDLVVQNAMQATQIEQAQAKIAELETKRRKTNASPKVVDIA